MMINTKKKVKEGNLIERCSGVTSDRVLIASLLVKMTFKLRIKYRPSLAY